ncbi:MAG: NUDIX hydrolase [Promethearchaeota archaeon]
MIEFIAKYKDSGLKLSIVALHKSNRFTEAQKRLYDSRHFPVRPHIGVGGVITWNNHVVIVKRKYEPNQGLWAIPGGHLELGERVEDGALRECVEETGLDLRLGPLASVINKIDRDKNGKIEFHYVLVDYWMEIVDLPRNNKVPDIKASSDALDARFVPYSDLLSYNLTKTVKELFRNLKIL